MKNQHGMQWIQTINNGSAMKRLGGYAILDDIDVIDHAAVLDFAIIVDNYLKMKEILENEKET